MDDPRSPFKKGFNVEYGTSLTEITKTMQSSLSLDYLSNIATKSIYDSCKNSLTGLVNSLHESITHKDFISTIASSMADITSYNTQLTEITKSIQSSVSLNYLSKIATDSIHDSYKNSLVGLVTSLQESITKGNNSTIASSMADITSYNTQLIEITKSMQSFVASDYLSKIATNSIYDSYKNSLVGLVTSLQGSIIKDNISTIAGSIAENSYKTSLMEITNSMNYSISRMISNITPFSEIIKELQNKEIVIEQDQTISCEGEVVHFNKLQEVIEQILFNSGLTHKMMDIDVNFDRIINEVHKLKGTLLKNIVIYFLLPLIITLLISFINPEIQALSDRYLSKNKRIVKCIQKEVSIAKIDSNLIRNHRLVVVNILLVRGRNHKNANIVGRLYFGNLVRMIDKKKDWTLIEWTDSAKINHQGWVYSRYLKKLSIQ